MRTMPVIRAPTDGVILEKFKEVGEIAVPGGFEGSGELIRMANLDDMRAELDVNESDLSRIRMDQPAEVPVGIVTAVCGVPFFLYLLRRARLGAFW